jgi:anti-sigma regulatory factor (Ser/Thr protein kinase)
MPNRLALRFDTDTRTFRAVRRFVRDLVRVHGGSEEDAVALEIATGELLSNAYEHAYARQSGPLEIDLVYDKAKIELTLHDDGEPITDSPAIPTTPPSGERGRGLYLVGQLTDESKVIHPWSDLRGIGVRVVKYLQRS